MGFEGGILRSSGPTATPADDSNMLALKGFAGATFRTPHQTFSASYAISGVHTASEGIFGFRKHLLDVSHGLSFSPDHYPLDVDTRFSTGRIEKICGSCDIPLSARFFGGNVERNFLSDPSWVIRD